MKTTEKREEVLANELENSQKQIDALKEENTRLTEEIRQLKSEKAVLSKRAATASKSMVSWKDHQDAIKASEEKRMEYAENILALQARYDKLASERRFWATQQWAKRFFRWLFLNRHLCVLLLVGMTLVAMAISVYLYVNLKNENEMLHATEMKYRFIRATGKIPVTMQFLDDSFDENDSEKLKYISKTVREYEQALIQKSDSIVRAERKKTKDMR